MVQCWAGMSDFRPLDPEAQLGYQLVRVADQVSRRWHAVLREHGINPRQFSVLALLAHDPGLSQAELARRVMITPQSMSESLAGLLAERLISREEAARGHAARVQLTAAGRKLLARAYPLVEACDRESFEPLAAAERAALARAFNRLLGSQGDGGRPRPSQSRRAR
jgi:DNA-binding MarR family transcriptional regulator